MRLVIYEYLPLSIVLFRLSRLSRFERHTISTHHVPEEKPAIVSLRIPTTTTAASCDFTYLIDYLKANQNVQVKLAVCRQTSQTVIARAHQLVQLVGPYRVQLGLRGSFKAYAEIGVQ